jgi:hypothetical protein
MNGVKLKCSQQCSVALQTELSVRASISKDREQKHPAQNTQKGASGDVVVPVPGVVKSEKEDDANPKEQ